MSPAMCIADVLYCGTSADSFRTYFSKHSLSWAIQTDVGHFCDILFVCLADGSHESRLNVKFVQDTSKFWYKPEISREQGKLLKDLFLN